MKHRRASAAAIAVLSLALSGGAVHAEEYTFDLAETEKKPYHLGGHLELKAIFSELEEYSAALQLEGGIERGAARLFVRTNTQLRESSLDSTFKTTVQEGRLTVSPASSLTIDAGKRTFKWGTGYAGNPVAFVDRPKNRDEPDLNLDGFVVASADFIKSFDGPLATLSVTPVLIPVSERVNEDFGKPDHLNVAGRVYLLLYDTDIDFLFLSGGSRTSRYGLDFSRNITTNLEVHGEYARIEASNWLLGLRYLTAKDTTFILEYYRAGTGFSEQQTRLQRYLYLRASQKEPFDILYWTPAVTAIVNADDGSCSIAPEIAYTGITNIEVRLKGTVLIGDRLSEFGGKPTDFRVELQARRYF